MDLSSDSNGSSSQRHSRRQIKPRLLVSTLAVSFWATLLTTRAYAPDDQSVLTDYAASADYLCRGWVNAPFKIQFSAKPGRVQAVHYVGLEVALLDGDNRVVDSMPLGARLGGPNGNDSAIKRESNLASDLAGATPSAWMLLSRHEYAMSDEFRNLRASAEREIGVLLEGVGQDPEKIPERKFLYERILQGLRDRGANARVASVKSELTRVGGHLFETVMIENEVQTASFTVDFRLENHVDFSWQGERAVLTDSGFRRFAELIVRRVLLFQPTLGQRMGLRKHPLYSVTRAAQNSDELMLLKICESQSKGVQDRS